MDPGQRAAGLHGPQSTHVGGGSPFRSRSQCGNTPGAKKGNQVMVSDWHVLLSWPDPLGAESGDSSVCQDSPGDRGLRVHEGISVGQWAKYPPRLVQAG